MNSQKIGQIVAAGAILLFGLFVVLTALTGSGNSLGAVAKFLAPAVFFISFFNGRIGLYLLIGAMAYSDLIKRFLIEYGYFSFVDITSILMICPLIMAATFVHFLIARVMTGAGRGKLNDIILLSCLVISGMISASLILKFGLSLGALKEIAHKAAYVPLVWVVASVFRDKNEVYSFVGYVLVIFIPVALYGVKQHFMGFTNFELNYLLSGFSTEAKHLREEEIHAFSTMSSSVPFGVTMGIMAGLTLLWGYARKDSGQTTVPFLIVLGVSIFVFAAYGSSKRSAWIVTIAILMLPWVFRSRILTRTFYAGGVVFAVALISTVKIILVNWGDLMAKANEILPGQLTLSTFSARLVSVYNWSRNPDLWTLAGVSVEERNAAPPISLGTGLNLDSLSSMLVHDMIGATLLNYGAPVLFILVCVGFISLRKIHLIVNRASSHTRRSIYAIYLSLVFGALLSGLSNSVIFPVNALAFLMIGLFTRTYFLNQELKKAAEEDSSMLPPVLSVSDRIGSIASS